MNKDQRANAIKRATEVEAAVFSLRTYLEDHHVDRKNDVESMDMANVIKSVTDVAATMRRVVKFLRDVEPTP